MKIGPKYKIAKRLGAPIFEKTQTQKFALSEARGGKRNGKRRGRRPGAMSDFKRQLIEKQKMRFTYGITEKQLRRYVDEAISKSQHPIPALIARLESRLDNIVYRLGFAPTRQASRQMVSHGHITLNGTKMTIPSHKVRPNDLIAVREGSRSSGLFANKTEEDSVSSAPVWVTLDKKHLSGTMKSEPTYEPAETLFDPEAVLEYYSR